MKIDLSNTKKLLFPKVFIGWVLYLVFLLNSYGQVLKPFEQRAANNSPTASLYQIKGDFTMIGNLDVSFGALLTGERFWLGGSAYYLTQPHLSFYTDRIGGRLPIKYNFHGGFVISINQDKGPFSDKTTGAFPTT
ncbi:MAG: type IX secretion system membrane protein PorP/SprF [Cyclobacteriaceae bacterium]